MSKKDKLVSKLLKSPSDFTWDELVTLLNKLGYYKTNAGKTSGSRVRFICKDRPPVTMHRPHPGSKLKRYQVKDLIKYLQREGLL